eukprot:355184-Chlamydomonas_euryale.AAC.1
MLKQGKVVVSTAGPYARYGNMLVEQAVEQGTHYCDITGEVLWVKRSIKQHNDKAVANGTKILHCCGFDSVPSDLGTLLMVDYMKKLGKKTDKASGGESRGCCRGQWCRDCDAGSDAGSHAWSVTQGA